MLSIQFESSLVRKMFTFLLALADFLHRIRSTGMRRLIKPVASLTTVLLLVQRGPAHRLSYQGLGQAAVGVVAAGMRTATPTHCSPMHKPLQKRFLQLALTPPPGT